MYGQNEIASIAYAQMKSTTIIMNGRLSRRRLMPVSVAAMEPSATSGTMKR